MQLQDGIDIIKFLLKLDKQAGVWDGWDKLAIRILVSDLKEKPENKGNRLFYSRVIDKRVKVNYA